MCIHQREGKDNHTVALNGNVNPVHSCDEIDLIQKHRIDSVAVCTEMPAIMNCDILPFNESKFKSQIGGNLLEQCIIYLHQQIQRLLWLPGTKVMYYEERYNPIFTFHEKSFYTV